MPRDDFTVATKRTLAQRAGGRCSFPGCDILCWLPGTEPTEDFTVGVAAHIKAASPGGPRYDENQTSEERKDISNGIYLCQTHSVIIDADAKRYPVESLIDYKKRHESQIRGEADGTWLLPEITIEKNPGISIYADRHQNITEEEIGDKVEHRLTIKNGTDYEFRRIGFSVMYPEFIKEPIKGTFPPGFHNNVQYEQNDWNVSVKGSGHANIPPIKYHGSINFEGTSLLQGQTIEILLTSKPDSITGSFPFEGKIPFWISGEVSVNIGTILKNHLFTVPLFYDEEKREISIGFIHTTSVENDKYITLTRSFF